MRIGVCASPEKLSRPVEGLDFIETTVAGALCPGEGESAFAGRLAAVQAAAAPVKAANCLLPADLKTTGPEVDFDAVSRFIATVCRRAQQAGIAVLVFGSGGSRAVPEGFDHAAATDQLVEHLKRWGPPAEQAGVTFAVEPLRKADCNIVNTVAEAAEIVRRADHRHVRLLADTYHMACDGDPPEAIAAAGELLAHAHCAEADGRGPLGTKGEDHRRYFRAMKDAGYDGRITIEAGWRDFERQLPQALKELRRQIVEA